MTKIERKPVIVNKSAKSGIEKHGKTSAVILSGVPDFGVPAPEFISDEAEPTFSQVESTIAANRAAAEARNALIDDENYYTTLVFQTQAQRDEFIQHFALADTLPYNNFDNRFLNGLNVSARLGHDIKAIELPPLGLRQKTNIFRKEVIINGKREH